MQPSDVAKQGFARKKRSPSRFSATVPRASGTTGVVSLHTRMPRGSLRGTPPPAPCLAPLAWGLCAFLLLLPCTSGHASWQGQKGANLERLRDQTLTHIQGNPISQDSLSTLQPRKQPQQHQQQQQQQGQQEMGQGQQQELRLFKSQRQRRFKWRMKPVFGLVPDARFMAQSVFESYGALADLTADLDATLYSELGIEGPYSEAPSTEVTPEARSREAAPQGTAVASSSRGGVQAEGQSQGQSQGQVKGRRLKEGDLPYVNLSKIPLPLLQAYNNTYSNGTFTPLAVNRTLRWDPLNKTYYGGGWDFFAGGYWTSLAWNTIYGAAAGMAWAIFGLGFVFVLLCMCLCCGDNWASLRDPTLRYSKKELLLPLILMLVGFAIAGAGLGVTIAGAVQFNAAAHNLTSFAVDEVQKTTDLVLNITNLLTAANSTGSSLDYNFPPKVQKRFSEVLGKADAIASRVKNDTQQGGDAVGKTLNTLQLVIFILGCITVGFMILGLVCGLCKWLVPSNMVTTILWLLIVATWVAVTVFVFVCLFEGDTSAAMGEVALNPAQKTALSRLVPCADPSVTANLGAFTRYMGYTTVALVNRTIVKSAPQVFTKVLKTPRGLCNPFGPPPMYKFDNSTCFKPQKPCKKEKGKKCPARVIDYPTLITKVADLPCPNDNPNKACITTDLATLIYAGETVVLNIGNIMPALKKIFRCAYIGYLAKNISLNADKMQSSATLLWIGFLLISVGAMIFALALPWYAFRKVRCCGDHEGDVEDGEWDEYGEDDKPEDGYDYNYEHDRDDDEGEDEEDDEDDHPKGKHRRDDSDANGYEYSDEDDHRDRRRDDGSEEHSDNYDRESDRYDDDESDRGSRRDTRRRY